MLALRDVSSHPPMAPTSLHIDLDADLLADLTAITSTSDISLEELVLMLLRTAVSDIHSQHPDRQAFEAWVKEQEDQGLRQAERGDLIPHEEVERIVASWTDDAGRHRSDPC